MACPQLPIHSELCLVFHSLQSHSCHFGHAFSPSVAVHDVAKLWSAAPLSVLNMSYSRYRWTCACKMTLMQITCSFRNPNNTEVCKKVRALSDQHCRTMDVLGNVSHKRTDQDKSSFWNMALVLTTVDHAALEVPYLTSDLHPTYYCLMTSILSIGHSYGTMQEMLPASFGA